MKKYISGKPFKTGAVNIKFGDEEYLELKRQKIFEIEKENDIIRLKLKMKEKDKIFGLGENLGGLNKRGNKFRCFSTDESEHNSDKEALYGSHPFFIIDSTNNTGVFFDYPGEIKIDFGNENKDEIVIELKDNFYLYIFEKDSLLNINKQFLELIGMPFVPPKWAFGYQQSKWGYKDFSEINDLIDNFKKNDIPCNVIYLDIDYMQDFKVFTINNEKFEDFEKLVKKTKKKGIRFVPIVDPCVKIEKGYPLYDEGVKNNYFCKTEDGEDFKVAVWPGLSHLPDFLNEKVREWWGNQYQELYKYGIEGFWNDMNEPAIFYTEEGLKSLFDAVDKLKLEKDPGFKIFFAKKHFEEIQNNDDDYKKIYQIDSDEVRHNHFDVHNLYGYNMAMSTAGFLKKKKPKERYFLLSRSSYIGSHRECAIWTGDNKSRWEHILINLKMMISLSMVGFYFTGADIGGFMGNASSDLLIRWSQLAIFTPLFRNHSAIFCRNQEPWAFDNNTTETMKQIIKLRYSLTAYIYSEYMKAVINSDPLFKSIGMVYEKEEYKEIEDQFIFGESLIVTPIYEKNNRYRYITLPDKKYLFMALSDYKSRKLKFYNCGVHKIKVELNEVPIFIKENSMLILHEALSYIGEKEITEIDVIAYVSEETEYFLYDDDGLAYDYKNKELTGLKLKIVKSDNDYKINHEIFGKTYIKRINFEIYDNHLNIIKKTIVL